jgi:hypothetical protein
VQAVLEVPPHSDPGGEWELLLAKIRAWIASGAPQALWQRSRLPFTNVVTLVVLLVVLQLYTAVLGALNAVPLLPGLLELVGVLWLARYGLPKLLRSHDRQQLFNGVAQRWQAFRGSR